MEGGGGGGDLGNVQGDAVGGDEVGEGAADVDADEERGRLWGVGRGHRIGAMKLRYRAVFGAVGSLLLALAGCNSHGAGRPVALLDAGTGAPGHASAPVVDEDEIKADVYFLASDRLEGRGVGTDGLDVAADYIATRFASLGLRPLPGLGSYFQPFEMTTAESIDPA